MPERTSRRGRRGGGLSVLVSLAALLVAACALPGNTMLTIGEKDANREITLRPGDQLAIVLEANVTTGYTWVVAASDVGVVKQVGEPQYRSESSAVGAGGQLTTRFTAVAAGRTLLTLGYRRPFESATPPVRTFSVTIVVK